MRYIRKNINSQAAKLLTTWKKDRKRAGQDLSYEDFRDKSLLNDILRDEQGGICCYCQQKITHYQGDPNGGSHNEHFLPQNGTNARTDLQTEYRNIYACCNYTKGMRKDMQHCGEAKEDAIIYDFIKKIDCNTYFKYNTLGEILPQGVFNTISEFEGNKSQLTDIQKEVLNAIKILKLNQESLKLERKKDQTVLFKMLNPMTEQQIQTSIQVFNQKPYKRFVDMLLYYMRRKIKQS